MTSKKFEVLRNGVAFPRAYTTGPEVRVQWNYRHGAKAAVSVIAWGEEHDRSQAYRISLGDLLRGLGVTAEDCAAALAEGEVR